MPNLYLCKIQFVKGDNNMLYTINSKTLERGKFDTLNAALEAAKKYKIFITIKAIGIPGYGNYAVIIGNNKYCIMDRYKTFE